MIDARHVRAARALLGWKQQDLARHSGLSLGTIKQFELEHVRPKEATRNAIIWSLRDAGVSFQMMRGINFIGVR